jgi:SAM-dependent methyltransferase
MRRLSIYMQMLFRYKPKRYWNDILSESFDLRGVGHFGLSEAENAAMYAEKRAIIERELARQSVAIGPDTRVLEIGSGVGFWTEFLRSKGVRHYTGNDIAQVSVQTLSARYPDFTFVHGDAGDIALPRAAFDLAWMIDVTQHITDDDAFTRAIGNVWQALRPGATFVVTFWDPHTNKYLANKLRLNRIEKPRGLAAYRAVFGPGAELTDPVPFNDKHLLVVRKNN